MTDDHVKSVSRVAAPHWSRRASGWGGLPLAWHSGRAITETGDEPQHLTSGCAYVAAGTALGTQSTWALVAPLVGSL